ncbi:MAG: hypothetical protein K2Y40_13645 [Reyranella sp.]|jgi:hypothetical protein|nr:hypothetical protein [Reyranella sp.]
MKTLYTSDSTNFYEGDMQDGDREATAAELAARDAGQARRDAMPTYTEKVDALIEGGEALEAIKQRIAAVVAIDAAAGRIG